jgi:hypothetical protein
LSTLLRTEIDPHPSICAEGGIQCTVGAETYDLINDAENRLTQVKKNNTVIAFQALNISQIKVTVICEMTVTYL